MNRKMIGRYIVSDPRICHGKPTFRGTRIMVSQVLEQLASGMAWETIVEERETVFTMSSRTLDWLPKLFFDNATEANSASLPTLCLLPIFCIRQ